MAHKTKGPGSMANPIRGWMQRYSQHQRLCHTLVLLRIGIGLYLLHQGRTFWQSPEHLIQLTSVLQGWLHSHPLPILGDHLSDLLQARYGFMGVVGVVYSTLLLFAGMTITLGVLLPVGLLCAALVISVALVLQGGLDSPVGWAYCLALFALMTLYWGEASSIAGLDRFIPRFQARLDKWMPKPKPMSSKDRHRKGFRVGDRMSETVQSIAPRVSQAKNRKPQSSPEIKPALVQLPPTSSKKKMLLPEGKLRVRPPKPSSGKKKPRRDR
jgi:hypothetical protein